MPEGQVHWATPYPREPEEPPEPQFEDELAFLTWVWRNPTKSDRLRVAAAQTICKFKYPELKAIAHIPGKESDAAKIDRARERAANVIKFLISPKAIEQHPPSELKPTNGSFKRRF